MSEHYDLFAPQGLLGAGKRLVHDERYWVSIE